ncbi:MAG TPA: hypothetical protein VKQ72_11205 [Aggregatilineales bacterium]|nr:hypothetical protein [Aggregatilineales bacterium]
MNDRVFYPYVLCMAILSLYLVWIGARGLLRPRPFLVPTRQTIIVLIPVLLIGVIIWLPVLPIVALFGLVIAVFILYSLLDQFRGCAVMGVTSESFRAALHSAFDRLNLPFQETMGRIHLTSLNADLAVGVEDTMGVGFLRMKQKGHEATAHDIASAMTTYFASDSAPMVKTGLIVNISFGILLLALVVYQIATRSSFLTGS